MIQALHVTPHREPILPMEGAVEIHRRHIHRLKISAFRSIAELDLQPAPGATVLVGDNGSGKTNVLEAISFFAPGSGLRGSRLGDARRIGANDTAPWAIHAEIADGHETHRIGAGLSVDAAGRERRVFRHDGEPAKAVQIAALIPMTWLTPALELLFEGRSSARRRFFDRLVCAIIPAHAADLAAYERAITQRLQLLKGGQYDSVWLSQLEAIAARAGAAAAAARAKICMRLQQTIAIGGPWSRELFPRARLEMHGSLEQAFAKQFADSIEDDFRNTLAAGRLRDAAAGRTLHGIHRSELRVWHEQKDVLASQASTGEQTALLLNILLAHAQLTAEIRGTPPLLLLDETAARLDSARRQELFRAIIDLGLQVIFTGQTEDFFSDLIGARIIHLARGEKREAQGAPTREILS